MVLRRQADKFYSKYNDYLIKLRLQVHTQSFSPLMWKAKLLSIALLQLKLDRFKVTRHQISRRIMD